MLVCQWVALIWCLITVCMSISNTLDKTPGQMLALIILLVILGFVFYTAGAFSLILP